MTRYFPSLPSCTDQLTDTKTRSSAQRIDELSILRSQIPSKSSMTHLASQILWLRSRQSEKTKACSTS